MSRDVVLQRVGEVRRFSLFTAVPAGNTDVTVNLGLGTYWLSLIINMGATAGSDTLTAFLTDVDGVILDDIALNFFVNETSTIVASIPLTAYQGYAIAVHPTSASAAISAAVGPVPFAVVRDLVVRWTAGTMADGTAINVELVAVRAT